jgi:hypothetical protein
MTSCAHGKRNKAYAGTMSARADTETTFISIGLVLDKLVGVSVPVSGAGSYETQGTSGQDSFSVLFAAMLLTFIRSTRTPSFRALAFL